MSRYKNQFRQLEGLIGFRWPEGEKATQMRKKIKIVAGCVGNRQFEV